MPVDEFQISFAGRRTTYTNTRHFIPWYFPSKPEMSRLLQVLGVLTVLTNTGLAAIISSVYDLPTLHYDFIVVGGENLSPTRFSKC